MAPCCASRAVSWALPRPGACSCRAKRSGLGQGPGPSRAFSRSSNLVARLRVGPRSNGRRQVWLALLTLSLAACGGNTGPQAQPKALPVPAGLPSVPPGACHGPHVTLDNDLCVVASVAAGAMATLGLETFISGVVTLWTYDTRSTRGIANARGVHSARGFVDGRAASVAPQSLFNDNTRFGSGGGDFSFVTRVRGREYHQVRYLATATYRGVQTAGSPQRGVEVESLKTDMTCTQATSVRDPYADCRGGSGVRWSLDSDSGRRRCGTVFSQYRSLRGTDPTPIVPTEARGGL